MGFQGADTAALREQARAFQECGKAMLERSSTLTSAVMTVAWVGPDADEMRRRWTEVDQQLRSSAQSLSARAKELAEHAEEQDAASQGDGGEGGSLWDRLGLPSLSDLFTNAGSRLSDAVGWARKLADAVAPGGPGGDNPLLAAMDPGSDSRGAASADPGEISDFIGRIFGDGDAGDDPDADVFSDKPGDEGSTTREVELPDGTRISVTTEDGAKEVTLTDSQQREISASRGNSELGLSSTVDRSASVKVNPDGTLTYTFDLTFTDAATAGGEKHGSGIDFDHTMTESKTYEVTVPEGTSLSEAMRIDHLDPSTIPEGASVSISTSDESSTGADVSVDTKRLPPLSFGASAMEGEGTSTVISRADDGTLSITAGPSTATGSDGSVGVGPEFFKFTGSSSHRNESSVLEHAQFADSREGNQAYSDAISSGKLPEKTSTSVLERYTESREHSYTDGSRELQIGDGSVSDTNRFYSQEKVTRTHSDGTEEWSQQILPNSTGDYARAYGGTGRETEYQLHIEADKGVPSGEGSDQYPDHTSTDLDLRFTGDELQQARENSRGGDTYRDNANYLASVAQASDGQPRDASNRLYNDYNGIENAMDPGPKDPKVPGRLAR